MRALVTGADGFVGRWLVEELERAGDHVLRAIGGGPAADDARTTTFDLRERHSIEETLAWADADAIYHLAAVSFGPDAASDIGAAVDVTVRGTAHLLQAAAYLPRLPRVLIPSSSEVYGAVGPMPVDESQPVAPVNGYGATKAAQEAFALAYHRMHGIPMVVTRSFNHIGPGQRTSFVVASFAAQLAAIATGQRVPVMHTGNLESSRDFTDVRDVVRAYRALMTAKFSGIVNVASGRAISVSEILRRLISISGQEVTVSLDASRLRPIDVPRIEGNPGLLHQITGWEPRISLETTLADIWSDALTRAS